MNEHAINAMADSDNQEEDASRKTTTMQCNPSQPNNPHTTPQRQ